MIDERPAELRKHLERRGISDRRALDVIGRTRRDLFVPQALRHLAYHDDAMAIGEGQTISQPYMVALMTEELRLRGDETVLEIGTGSGYQAAILSQLCRQVVTIERISELSLPARRVLASLDYENIEFRVGDGTLGCPERAPYDAIIVTAAAPRVPEVLYDQLAPGGRLVIPVGDERVQTLQVIEKHEAGPTVRSVCDCRFVKLIGKEGWPEE